MAHRLDTASHIIQLSRPRNAINPVLALLTGAIFGGAPELLNTMSITVALLIVVVLNFAFTLQNDLVDSAIDKKAKRKTALLTGIVTGQQVELVTKALLAIAIAVPLLLSLRSHVIFAIGYGLVAWQYNMRPIQASRRPLSSIMVLALLLSVLPFAFGLQLAGQALSLQVVLFALGLGMYRWSTSVLKDYKDFVADRGFLKKTFLIAFGPRAVRSVCLVLYAIGALSMIGLTVAQTGYDIVNLILAAGLLIGAGLAFLLRQQLSVQPKNYAANNDRFHTILDIQLIFEAGLLTWLYIS